METNTTKAWKIECIIVDEPVGDEGFLQHHYIKDIFKRMNLDAGIKMTYLKITPIFSSASNKG